MTTLMAPYDLSSLDVVAVVGEPLNPEAWHWTYETLGRSRIYVNNTWGQTELSGCPLCRRGVADADEARIVRLAVFRRGTRHRRRPGRPVGVNVAGNLVIRRPFPMMLRGLWKEPERYVRSYFSQVPGCYFTNDAAIRDERRPFLGDRSRGRHHQRRRPPAEHDGDGERDHGGWRCCRGGGRRHAGRDQGNRPAAFVTLKAGESARAALEQAIRDRVTPSISKIAVPEQVIFTDVMPKTPSGKIMRRLLKEIVSSGEVGLRRDGARGCHVGREVEGAGTRHALRVVAHAPQVVGALASTPHYRYLQPAYLFNAARIAARW